MDEITFRPIGVIRSPHQRREETPIQPVFARGIEGRVELFPEYAEGLAGLEEFSHVHLIYHLHLVDQMRLTCVPFLDDEPHGVFATRGPWRPNPIGMSLVRVLGVEGTTVSVIDVDILDGTPLLDIKPLFAGPDPRDPVRRGWLDRVDEATRQARGMREYKGGS